MVFPGKPEEEQLVATIQVKVTAAEHKALKALAKSGGFKLSAVGREFFLGLLKQKGKR